MHFVAPSFGASRESSPFLVEVEPSTGTMPRFEMTTLHPSFGRVYLASKNWIEVELSEGLALSLEHCYELEHILRKETNEPYVMLGHCRVPQELQFEAKSRISTLPGCAAVALMVHSESCAEPVADVIAVAEVQQGNVRSFDTEAKAHAWLKTELRSAREDRGIAIELPQDPR